MSGEVSVANGVASAMVKCIGCGQEFEDFWLENQDPDPLPVCEGCERTMEPV